MLQKRRTVAHFGRETVKKRKGLSRIHFDDFHHSRTEWSSNFVDLPHSRTEWSSRVGMCLPDVVSRPDRDFITKTDKNVRASRVFMFGTDQNARAS